LVPFVCDVVEQGSTVSTDGWDGYNDLATHGFIHRRTIFSDSGDPAHVSMPGVHRVSALLKRWLLGTHQGAVESDHLQRYLDEFTFRFIQSIGAVLIFADCCSGAALNKPCTRVPLATGR
jgi:transposase-like protein